MSNLLAINACVSKVHELEQSPEWQNLRRGIYKLAIRFGDHLIFDFREMLAHGREAESAGRLMWQMIKPLQPSVLVGPGFGSTPLLYSTAIAALADGVNLSILMVRDQRKDHNRKKWVEGKRQPPGSRTVLIDDFMKNGSALNLIERALKADNHELNILGMALFFDMWEPLGSRQISMSKMPILSLFSRHDIGLSRDCFDAVPPLMKGSYPDFISDPLWWRFDLNDKNASPHKTVPVIVDKAVFVADDHSRVWRHHLYKGDIEWQYNSLAEPAKGIVQHLQYAENSLVFGCYDGTVTRLDADTGDILWRWRQDSSVHATPELDLTHRRLFINTEQWNQGQPFGHLQALDWDSGRLIWSYPQPYWPPGSPAYCAATNLVVATCNDLSVVAVKADSGEVVWQAKTLGLVRGKPAIVNQKVYLATEKGRLHCLDLLEGKIIWTTRYGSGARHLFVHEQQGLIYLFDAKWHFTAFDALSGEIRWLSRLRSAGCWCPVVYGKYLITLSKGGHIAVFDPQKEIKVWEGNIGGSYHQPPAAANHMLVAASNNQGLKAFEIHPFYSL